MANCNHRFVFVLSLIIIISLFNSTAGKQSNDRVNSVCNQTPNPKFCVDAIYTDPRAPDADIIALAYISFSLAFTNATNTLSFITDHHNPNNGSHGVTQEDGLKQCSLDYQNAKTALDAALADMDADTYELGQYADVAAQSAVHCELSLNATKMISSSLQSELTRRNTDLKLLAAICSVISSTLVGSTSGEQSNETVDSICKQTPNPKFCFDAIYADPRASDANLVALAYISFRLADTNATNILRFIGDHQKRKNKEGLKKCSLDYQKAVTALDAALADLDSDTFELGKYATVAAQSADNCEDSLNATKLISSSLHSQLTRRNTDFKLLAGICSVISSMLVA